MHQRNIRQIKGKDMKRYNVWVYMCVSVGWVCRAEMKAMCSLTACAFVSSYYDTVGGLNELLHFHCDLFISSAVKCSGGVISRRRELLVIWIGRMRGIYRVNVLVLLLPSFPGNRGIFFLVTHSIYFPAM